MQVFEELPEQTESEVGERRQVQPFLQKQQVVFPALTD